MALTAFGKIVSIPVGVTVGTTALTEGELAVLDSVTAGTAAASKAVVLDASADITSGVRDIIGARNQTLTGTLGVTGVMTTGAVPITTSGVGTKNGSTVTVVEAGTAIVHRTTFTLTATPITVTDEAGVAQWGGSANLYTFPQGLICTLGAVLTGNLTLGTTGTIIAAFTGVNAIGTVARGATGAATLVSTAADILQSTANATASGAIAAIDSVSVAAALTEAGARWFDGTATAKEMYLNVAIADDATHTSGTGTFTGTIVLTWLNLGDN